ncbi:MAG: TetR/AcrR family transcriptional regulator, partial [Lachnospiraceae bacterium]|nr:TetR/AcrR family transcriptional regulator [Lachnospiraceae bacterium]
MNDRFFDLKKEKQYRMISAALKIFAENGYRNSSTDDIVKEAHISKGLLFHYFDSKLGLYSFLYSYSVRYLAMEIDSAVGKEERDFFKLYRGIEQAKFMVLRNYPYMKLFLDNAQHETVSEALLATEDYRAQY